MGKDLQTVAAMTCMKSLLMLFNVVFWISGIAIFIVGIWMEMELYKYMEMSTEFSSTAPYVLIGTGTLIVIIGSLACCCTIKGQPVLLYLYGGFLAIIFVLEVGAGISIFAYRTKLMEGFNKGLNQGMVNYKNDSVHQADFDFVQQTLECCGNHYPTDWENLTPPIPIPSSCCKVNGCDTAEPSEVFEDGCYSKVINFLDVNIGTVGGTAVGIAIFPLVGVILSCCLAGTVNKAKYEQMT